jgi:hypothetical protein
MRCSALAWNSSRDTINARSSDGVIGDSATVTRRYLCSMQFLISLSPRACGSATSSVSFSRKSLASQYRAQNPQLPVNSNSLRIGLLVATPECSECDLILRDTQPHVGAQKAYLVEKRVRSFVGGLICSIARESAGRGSVSPRDTSWSEKCAIFAVKPSYSNQRADTYSCFIWSKKLSNLCGASTRTTCPANSTKSLAATVYGPRSLNGFKKR